MKRIFTIFAFIIISLSANSQNWYQVGFKLSANFPLNRDYADDLTLSTIRDLYFCGFFRAGTFVLGEVGFGYHYFKGNYTYNFSDNESLLESRHLVIPVKIVGNVKLSRSVYFMPQVGISYQPLVGLKGDVINFNKKMIENHWTLLTAGFDFKFGFIILGVDYRYSFQKYFRNRGGKNPQFINVNIGVQF